MKNISVKHIVSIILFSALIGIAYNFISPEGIKLFENTDTANTNKINNESLIIIPEINLEQAENIFDSEGVVFIDARDNWDFTDGHIKGAVNVPEYKFDEVNLAEVIPDRSMLYIVYCSDVDCGTSKKLADKLALSGYENIIIFSGGWYSWLEKGLPTE